MAREEPLERTYATPDEAARALASLSDADLMRVERFARVRAAGLRPSDWEDLVQEAIARLLAGSRRWPKDVPLVVFLRGTIRSLAEEERRLRAQAGGGLDSTEEDLTQVRDVMPDAERTISARNELHAVLTRFTLDPIILQLIGGLERGETAAETCARTGINPQQYDAARKRFRRAVDAWLDEEEGLHG